MKTLAVMIMLSVSGLFAIGCEVDEHRHDRVIREDRTVVVPEHHEHEEVHIDR